jgi:RND family efflux transporter MFP subunit
MKDSVNQYDTGSNTPKRSTRPGKKVWVGSAAAVIALAVAGGLVLVSEETATPAHAAAAPTLSVKVSTPLERNLEPRLGFLGQFSAVDRVELRAQVGGTLTAIRFKDGDVVRKGDLLFEIDPVPYEIKLSQATAQLEAANARLVLATRELTRAQELKRSDAGTTQNVDQRAAELQAAQAAVAEAKALIRDARFDLDHCRITAPFTGRIGNHLVSVGNLVAGSRAATSPTTLLTTLVSLDPMYVDFDMSEGDYMAFLRAREKQPQGTAADRVEISLSDETNYSRQGKLNFVDNALNQSSGTIHARAVVSNSDLLLTPGGFARVRLALSAPSPTLLVPDDAVIADQSEHIVLTVGANDTVTPKRVQIGDLRDGLRVIRSGLTSSDRIIIDGIPLARPGSKVSPQASSIQLASEQPANTANAQVQP